jgi:hypothetical protein
MDIKSPRLLKIKGLLFLLLGILSTLLLWAENPSLKTLILLVICLWSFCRFYYFAFYVLQHYADPDFRYSGLWDLFLYLTGFRKTRSK